MNKQLLASFLIVAIVLTVQSDSRASPVYKLHFPIGHHQPYPNCDRQDNIGIAWLAANVTKAQEDMDNFCASMWYNSSGRDFTVMHPGEIPHVWCDTNSEGTNYYDVIQTVPASWSDYMLMFNEPGTPGQCGITNPYVAASIHNTMAGLGPQNARIVGPNIIIQHQGVGVHGIGWLRTYLLELERLQGGTLDLHAVGIHLYGAHQYTPPQKLQWVIDMLNAIGYPNMPVIITEYGVHQGEDAFNVMSDTTVLLANSRVEAIFGYTVRDGQFAITWEDNTTGWMELSESGLGLFDGYYRMGIVGN